MAYVTMLGGGYDRMAPYRTVGVGASYYPGLGETAAEREARRARAWDAAETIIDKGVEGITSFFDMKASQAQSEAEVARAEAAKAAALRGDTASLAKYFGADGGLTLGGAMPWVIGGAVVVGLIVIMGATRGKRRKNPRRRRRTYRGR